MFYADNRQYERNGVYDDDIQLLAIMVYGCFKEMTFHRSWRTVRPIPHGFIVSEQTRSGTEIGAIKSQLAICFPVNSAVIDGVEQLEALITRDARLPVVRQGSGPLGYVDMLIEENRTFSLRGIGLDVDV